MISTFVSKILQARKTKYLDSLKSRGLKLGKNVFLNDGYFLDPAHCFLIAIDDDVVFGPGVKIFAHDASSKKLIGKTKIAPVKIGRDVFVGGFSVILPGVTIGSGSIIGAHSTVTKSIPAGEVWGGNPAKQITTVEELRKKLLSTDKKTFPYSQFAIQNVTEARKAELIAYLEKEGFAFIE